MLNAVSGVLRGFTRARSKRPDRSSTGRRPETALRLQAQTVRYARRLADAIAPGPITRPDHPDLRSAGSRRVLSARRRLIRRHLALRLTSDRMLPIAIAMIVLAAAGISLAPAVRPVGAAQAGEQSPRLAIGGPAGVAARTNKDLGASEGIFQAEAPGYLDDGTIYKPVAVDTTVQSSEGLLRHYTVRDGDTLTGIASKFGVSMMTVWWANHLTSTASLKLGMDLVIPPVNGLVVTVAAGDTLDSLSAEYGASVEEIIAANDLQDPNLIVGQVLMLPGAKGDPIAAPKPTARPASRAVTSTTRVPTYTGGAWAWPVIGGGNYVSQYFHYGHLGVDVAATYGSPIVSPLAGVVVFAGWKSNGGGYQVWIQHGNGIYSASHHMSAVTVSTGQSVSKGQRVGRVGQSGWATGPHDHFEVWIGSPWKSGSYRVNPLRYY